MRMRLIFLRSVRVNVSSLLTNSAKCYPVSQAVRF